eukprot:4021569-Amphidinium_carterae.3
MPEFKLLQGQAKPSDTSNQRVQEDIPLPRVRRHAPHCDVVLDLKCSNVVEGQTGLFGGCHEGTSY